MIYDPETDPHLKSWLVKNLEPICDAEPGALADYILALLKHQASEPELRIELVSQLEEFLEKETSNFIDLLFNALRSKSYLPYAASPPHAPRSQLPTGPAARSDSGIPIPLDTLNSQQSSSRKRGLEQPGDEHEYRKGPRLSNDPQVSRYGPNGRGFAGPVRGGRGGAYGGETPANGAPYSNGRPPQRPQEVKKGVCRDYHNYGYCSRGAYCKYSHGEDAVVPSQLLPMPNGMMPFMSMMNNAMFPGGMPIPSNSAYDPHERIDMRQRQPVDHRQDGTYPSSYEPPVVQDLTPRMPTDDHQNGYPRNGHHGYSSSSRMEVDSEGAQQQPPYSQEPFQPGPNYRPGNRPNSGFRGGRRGARPVNEPGVFPMAVDDLPSGEAPSTPANQPLSAPRPERRNDKTLVVEKIPEEQLSLGAVNDWFKRFGTVTNVAVDVKSAKALVSFSDHEEAHKAWKSEDAVFGNRFVKVFWHRPMGGHGSLGAKMLKASAPLVSKLGGPEANGSSVPASSTPPNELKKPAPTPVTSVSALAAKEQSLKQQILEQKTLMAKLESAASPEEKKELLGRLRKLGEEMKTSSTVAAPAPAAAVKEAPATDQAQVEKERLDKELELHAVSTALDGEEESTEDLKAKLEKLKAEAASLGLAEADPSYPPFSGGYRPYRGRGRGAPRGGYYGRGGRGGGPPRTSMKLDNRPRKLLLKGVNDEGIQTVKDWYATTGLVESVEKADGGDVVVSFKTRAGAEQGFAKGSNVPTVGQVQVSWHTDQPAVPGQQSQQPSTPAAGKTESKAASSAPSATHDSHGVQEEEAVASGWGDDGEDGMGMI